MYIFPAHIFNPNNVKAGVRSKVISGGTSISGIETVIATDGGGLWNVTYDDIDIADPEIERLWDAWVSYLQGGVRRVLVPLLSLNTAPIPYVGYQGIHPSDLEYDDVEFPTVVKYKSPYITARVVGPRSIRSTEIEIEVTQGSKVFSGQKFSIDNRSYLIERVKSRPNDYRAVCAISPPLRKSVTTDTPVNFEWPLVQCRMVMDQDLIPMMEMGKYSNVSISFIEDLIEGVDE